MGDPVAEDQRLFYRELPPTGFVAIMLRTAHEGQAYTSSMLVGELVLERRAEGIRRAAGRPPVLLRVSANSLGEILDELLPLAMSDAAIARLVGGAAKRPRESTGRPSGPRRSPGGFARLRV
jgi:hypothetical protein